jgi:hypothetical protein
MELREFNEIPKKIYALFEGEDPVNIEEGLVEELSKDISRTIQSRLQEKRNYEPREYALRMSSIGKPLRQLWYEARHTKTGTLRKPRGSDLIKFLYGDIIEEVLVFLLKAAGYKISGRQSEVTISGVKGHKDFNIEDWLVDAKSASSNSFGKFRDHKLFEANQDAFGYIQQIKGYAEGEDHSLDKTGWIVMDKQHGTITTLPFDTLRDDTKNTAARIEEVRKAISQEEPPERCYEDVEKGTSGNRVLATGCAYCQFREECWGSKLRTFRYSNGLVHFTKVVKEPSVPEITRGGSVDSDESFYDVTEANDE